MVLLLIKIIIIIIIIVIIIIIQKIATDFGEQKVKLSLHRYGQALRVPGA